MLELKVSSNAHNESVLRTSGQWASAITWGLITTTGLTFSWLALAKTEEIVVAAGTLVPIGSVQDIQMPMGGIVDEILVKEGDRVGANDILIKLDTEASAQRLKSLNENIEFKRRQLQSKKLNSIDIQDLIKIQLKP